MTRRSGGATGRRSRIAAGALLAVSLAMAAFSLASVLLPDRARMPSPPDIASFLVVCSNFLVFPLVGGVLAVRRPHNPIGWLFLVIGVCFNLSPFATEYVGRSVFLGPPLPGYTALGWAAQWSFVLAIEIALVWVPLLFPTGRPVSSRWWAVGWVATGAMAAGVIGTAFAPGVLNDYDGRVANPVAAPEALGGMLSLLSAASLPVTLVCSVLAVASLGLRYRRGVSVERQQLKLFLLACAAFALLLAPAVATGSNLVFYAAFTAFAGIPVAAAVAVLRYRLFEIDRIISRSLAWALATAIVVGVFAAVVVGLQALLAGATQGQTLAVAASTLVAAALFQPVRRRIQAVVDRRFNRARYDGDRVVTAYAVQLQTDLGLDAIRVDLGDVVQRALQPAWTGLWLKEDRP